MDEHAISLLECNQVLFINNTDYLLVEFPFGENIEEICYLLYCCLAEKAV